MTGMTISQQILTVAAVIAGTMLTRFLPFLLFPADKPLPDYIRYLGNVLPAAVTGLLVVYCLRGVSWTCFPYGSAEILSVVSIVLLHRWKHNMFLSIAGGTALYMMLIRLLA